MRRPLSSLSAATVLALAVSACGGNQPNQYLASACPIPGNLRGYPVSASSGAPVDTALLGSVARAMAASLSRQLDDSHATVPSSTAAKLMDATLDRGDVFERYGWRPAPGDTAKLLVTYRPGQAAPEIALAHAGADTPTSFEQSVQRAALAAVDRAREMPGARHTLPLTIAMPDAHPVAIEVAFGREADAPSGIARFSIHEQKVLPLPSNPGPTYPTNARAAGIEGDVRVAFVVRPDSTADLGTVHVVESSRPDFATSVVHSLARARYYPGEIDCRLVPTVVEQPFHFRMNHQLLSDQ